MMSKSWPAVSKGIFYEGFNKGKSPGKMPSERATGPKYSGAKGTPYTRVVQGGNKLNPKGMRIPHS